MTTTADIAEIKAALRREVATRLAGLDAPAAREGADRVAERVLGLPEIAAARGVLCCLSFGSEIDTRRLIDRLLASGREVYVPRAGRSRRLFLHPFPCPLKTLSFGLEQPLPAAPQLPPEEVDRAVDAALILGLAYDHRGYRLGYGAGYFDRFLAGRTFPKIGLAYELQRVAELPVEPHDVAMSMVVTESGVHRAAPNSDSG